MRMHAMGAHRVVLHARDQSIHPPVGTEHTREVHSAALHT
jgi:hypothetical protein